MPVFAEWLDNNDVLRYSWKQGRNLKLYSSVSDEGFFYYADGTSFGGAFWENSNDITNNIFNVPSWTPSLVYNGADPLNRQNKIQYMRGDISNYLKSGEFSTFYVETTDAPTYANYTKTSVLQIIITVEGYKY